ncbi:efflux RND transporter periplasmic adaptor subunit [Rhodoblastus sp.]|uniref:efflux RND transporter periplasmic adaptor subunit n=1 Tax=Rhodoblastus sp. TaxID=1962975 RepID=UPI003F957BD1
MSETSSLFSAAPAETLAEPDAWRVFAQSENLEEFARAWIALTVQSAEAIRRAVLLLGPPERGPFQPVAFHPDAEAREKLPTDNANVLRAALERRRPAVETDETGAARIGFPLVFAGLLHGAFLAEARPLDTAATRRLLRHVQWSAAGVEAFLSRGIYRQGLVTVDKAQFLVSALDSMAQESHGDDCARVFANLLARRFDCENVSVGRTRHARTRLSAASQTAALDRRNIAAKLAESAMDEAVDQEAALMAPRPDGAAFVAASAHDRLARLFPGHRLITLPLFVKDEALGAVSLRREKPFTQEEVDFIDAFAAAAAPMLREKWALDRSLPGLAWDRFAEFGKKFIGPRHFGWKLAGAAALLAALFLTFYSDVYRARAKAQIQGETRRMISAPFDGFIQAQFARAGDVVHAGFVLAQLQDNDLELERLRQVAHKREYQLELDKALAKRDLAEINIARAQIAETEAEIDLSAQMIARAKLAAPFDSVVVSGDLSQAVGKPVSRGDVLFELAPLDRYRVTAIVTEADIGLTRPGQSGELLLSALPDATFPIRVETMGAVAQAGEGVNGFEVIGVVESKDPRLRPGMEGVAKIEIGRRNIAWIWTHSLFDWLRVKIWSLVP